MSRIGRLPITIPPGVKVDIKGTEVSISGPKGKAARTFHQDMKIEMAEGKITISRPDDVREHRALHGLTRALLANMITGVYTGFEKNLELSGVGYRVEKSGNNLILRAGFSHPVEVVPKYGVTLTIEGTTKIKVSGTDKQAVGEMAAEIRGVRPTDAYKGKGIKYAGEYIKLKPGKTGKAVGSK